MAASQGLLHLAALDQVQVIQEARSRYVVRSAAGEELLTAEEPGRVPGSRNLRRDFDMPVYDSQGLQVMRFRRPLRFGPAKVEVWVQGEAACVVRQRMACMRILLLIDSAQGQPRYRVKRAPTVWSNRPVDYDLQTASKRNIGVVRKEYLGFKREAFSRLDNYTLLFPPEMDVRYKAGVIAACIMLDVLYYDG